MAAVSVLFVRFFFPESRDSIDHGLTFMPEILQEGLVLRENLSACQPLFDLLLLSFVFELGRLVFPHLGIFIQSGDRIY